MTTQRTIIGLLLAGGCALGALASCSGAPDGATGTTQPTASPTALIEVQASDRVVASGQVVPRQNVDLFFSSSGAPVAAILEQEGANVAANAPLARLDTRQLQLELEHAQAVFDKARADHEELLAGASPEEIAAAEAQVAQAIAQRRQRAGAVTSRDIAAAQATLAQAQARLDQLTSGPREAERAAQQARLDNARANLDRQRDALSAEKTNSYHAMQQAVTDLTQAQSSYTIAQQNWEHVEATGKDPIGAFRLSDAEKRLYYDAFIQAEATLRRTEEAVERARISYDAARQAEEAGVAAAEAEVRQAQADLDGLLAPAEADQIAEARAQVATAQAALDKLRGEERAGLLDEADAQVANAQASLDKLTVTPRSSRLASSQATVQQAEVAFKQAQLALDMATLKAPFAGTVAEVNIKVGELPGSDPAVVLIDTSSWQIETDDLTELQVVRVREGSAVTIAFDALPGLELPGRVARINPIGKTRQGDITYTVTVEPASWDPRLRWNMTATVSIEAAP